MIDRETTGDESPPRAAHRDGPFGFALLNGLGVFDKHVYGGTVDPAEVARRRRRNRAARVSRRVNRMRARS